MTVPDRIQLVEQTGNHDCGAACLAMVLGLRSSVIAQQHQLLRTVGELQDSEPIAGDDCTVGVAACEIMAVLWDRGILALHIIPPCVKDPRSWYDRVADQMPVLQSLRRIEDHLDDGGVAILGVASRKIPGGGHWIVAQGHALFDPNPASGNPYTNLQADGPLEVSEAILIGDAWGS
ncbi:hypothetical protein [Ferrovibrio terrae]|uniref:hypothetical protein n=1 Tax=Ferrovibrio terrae TaxID=2594003 RepID=UPI003137B74E